MIFNNKHGTKDARSQAPDENQLLARPLVTFQTYRPTIAEDRASDVAGVSGASIFPGVAQELQESYQLGRHILLPRT